MSLVLGGISMKKTLIGNTNGGRIGIDGVWEYAIWTPKDKQCFKFD